MGNGLAKKTSGEARWLRDVGCNTVFCGARELATNVPVKGSGRRARHPALSRHNYAPAQPAPASAAPSPPLQCPPRLPPPAAARWCSPPSCPWATTLACCRCGAACGVKAVVRVGQRGERAPACRSSVGLALLLQPSRSVGRGRLGFAVHPCLSSTVCVALAIPRCTPSRAFGLTCLPAPLGLRAPGPAAGAGRHLPGAHGARAPAVPRHRPLRAQVCGQVSDDRPCCVP